MTNHCSMIDYPISPPPELVQQIRSDALHKSGDVLDYELRMIHASYRAGADQELEACCEWLSNRSFGVIGNLRAARRPKPPSKKQRGLTALEATSLKKDDPLLYQEILNAIKELPDD